MYGSQPRQKYSWKDSNIGSGAEKSAKQSGRSESAWKGVGTRVGLQIWRIVNFEVTHWPTKQYGYFYNGDSYIVLNTYVSVIFLLKSFPPFLKTHSVQLPIQIRGQSELDWVLSTCFQGIWDAGGGVHVWVMWVCWWGLNDCPYLVWGGVCVRRCGWVCERGCGPGVWLGEF